MPIYDFQCENCGKVFERYVPTSKDIDEQYCDCDKSSCGDDCNCNQDRCKLTKIESFGSMMPIFKGKGFYGTDYKNK